MSLNSPVLKKFAKESKLSVKQVLAVIKLLEENNSVPFINYYRKDVTEDLSVIKIQKVAASYQNYKSLLARKELILSKIKDLDKLSDSLKSDILSCHDKTKLEDLYFPFKPNGNLRAESSKKLKLLPLAKYIWKEMLNNDPSENEFQKMVKEQDSALSTEKVIEEVISVLARLLSEDSNIRRIVRQTTLLEGSIVTKLFSNRTSQRKKYTNLVDFSKPINKVSLNHLASI